MEKLFLVMWVYEGLRNLFVFISAVGLFIGTIMLFIGFAELDGCCKQGKEREEEIKFGEKVKKIGIKFASAGVISFGLLCFVPSKPLFYSYVGYKAMKEMQVLEEVGGIGKKVVKVLNKKLDEMLDEKKESK